jgi:chemotaxis response regulator CheB
MIRTLIISNGLLLSSVIECLLSHEEDLLIATTNKSRLNHLLEEVNKTQPDVLIVDNENYYQHVNVLDELIKKSPNLRLLIVDPKSNFVYVYEKKQITILCAEDLLNVIKMN